jgi:hypothetical protein
LAPYYLVNNGGDNYFENPYPKEGRAKLDGRRTRALEGRSIDPIIPHPNAKITNKVRAGVCPNDSNNAPEKKIQILLTVLNRRSTIQ